MDPATQKDILKMEGVCSSGENGTKALKNIDLTIKSGEIIGIAGVDGNGQSELVDCITGLLPVKSGKVSINGEDLTNAKPKQVLDAKVSHIPADRLARGVVKSMNLSENILLMNTQREGFSKGMFMKWGAINNYAKEIIAQYNVKTPSYQELMQNLSGGNQQKVVLGREIERTPELLIAMHPARGLDIGATNFVQQNIVDERDRGAAVLLVSTELEEIYALSDRIAVMFEGEIMGIVPPTTPIDEIGMMMAGVRYEDIHKDSANNA